MKAIEFLKSLCLYLLVCFLVGHVVAQEVKSGKNVDDSLDLLPAQAQFFQ